MIRRWLWAIRAWWQAPVLAKLDQMEARWRSPRDEIIPPPPVTRWDCGHLHTGGAKDREGVSRCLACHMRGQ